MSRTLSALSMTLPLITIALTTSCGSQTTEAPDPEPVPVVERPSPTCPPAPDIVLRRWVQRGCVDAREPSTGYPGAVNQPLG